MSRSSHGLSTPTGADWREFSACRTEDPELFHPMGVAGRRGVAAQAQEDKAKAICATCPVFAVQECLKFALVFQPDGIAAGLNEEERRNLRAGDPDVQAAFDEAMRAPKEMCRRKHSMVGDNVVTRTDPKTGKVRRSCHICITERTATYAPRPSRPRLSRAEQRARRSVMA